MPDDTGTAPDSGPQNSPGGALTLQEAVAEQGARRAAETTQNSVLPTPAKGDPRPAPEPQQDTPVEAPEEVDEPSSEGDETSPEIDDTGEDGDYIELEDGTRIPVAEAVERHKRFGDLQARVTRKEQSLAAERQSFDSERSQFVEQRSQVLQQMQQQNDAINAMREDYAQRLEIMGNSLAAQDGDWNSVDWDKLRQEDPIAFVQQWGAYQLHERKKGLLGQEWQKTQWERQQQTEQMVGEARRRFQSAAAQLYPELVDPVRSSEHHAAMQKTALDIGYTMEEVLQTVDPRALVMWRESTLWRQMQAQKQAALAKPGAPRPDATGKIKVVKSRSARPPSVAPHDSALGRAQAAFNRSPTLETGAALETAKREARAARGNGAA